MTSTNTIFSTALTRTAAGAFAIAMTVATVSAAKAETADSFRAKVESSIDKELRLPQGNTKSRHGVATLAVAVGADGAVQSVNIVKSSGYAAFDQAAIRTAHRVDYPVSSRSRTVAMVLGFNEKVAIAQQREGRDLVAAYTADQKVRLADKTTAQQPDS